MRRSGVVTERRRRRDRAKRMRARAMIAGGVLLLCALAMSAPLREEIAAAMRSGIEAVPTFADTQTESVDITLPQMEMYALQLGVFDSGERAQSEQQRLTAAGVPCIVWQRDKMRIICAVAKTREGLDAGAAGENEAFVVKDVLPEVRLRLSCAAGESAQAARFVSLPDALLEELLSGQGRPIGTIMEDTRQIAQSALDAHGDNLLYAQLAQSLLNWCEIVKPMVGEQTAKSYAAATICTICREWRAALLGGYDLSEASTASAQRTPSTAADVMPPA